MALTLLEFVNRIGWEVDQTEFNNAIERTRKAVDKLKPAVGRLNLVVTTAFTALTTLSTKAASDATETQNKFNATFGEMQEAANSFADNFAKSLNKSDKETKESLASFQAFTVGLGFGQKEAFGMSKRLKEMSTDFGSFNNLSDGESQQRFISAMSGSSEVVDRFGINLKVANLDLKLQELGLAESTRKANEMQKAVARLAIIEESLGRQGALGDAQRTLGEFASTARGVRALIERVAVSFGKLIVPVANLVGKGLILFLKAIEAIPAPIKIVMILLSALIVVATNASFALLVLTGALATLNGWLVRSGININTMTAAQIKNVALTKLQNIWTIALTAATKLYNAAAARFAIVNTLGAIAMKLGAIASGALAIGMKVLAVATTVASGGLTLIIPLIVGLIIGITAAIKAVRRGTSEVSKFGIVFKAVGKALKNTFLLFTFFHRLVFNIFDGLSDILLAFLEPIFGLLGRLFKPLFVAINLIQKKFGSFEDFLFEVMVRMLTPLAEFEMVVGKWSENIVKFWENMFSGIAKSGKEFMNSPAGKFLMSVIGNTPAGMLGRKLFDIASQIQPLQPQAAVAGGGAPLPSIATNSVNMNNEITNTIEIKNGMSATEAEDVIVRANRRSMKQMANDAMRNTSGVD
jgi:hypothetical protein